MPIGILQAPGLGEGIRVRFGAEDVVPVSLFLGWLDATRVKRANELDDARPVESPTKKDAVAGVGDRLLEEPLDDQLTTIAVEPRDLAQHGPDHARVGEHDLDAGEFPHDSPSTALP